LPACDAPFPCRLLNLVDLQQTGPNAGDGISEFIIYC